MYTSNKKKGCASSRSSIYDNKKYSKYLVSDNLASEGIISQTPRGSQPGSLANDGNTKSCSKTKGTTVTLQVDLQKESIVTGVHITFGGMCLNCIQSNAYAKSWSVYTACINYIVLSQTGTQVTAAEAWEAHFDDKFGDMRFQTIYRSKRYFKTN